MKTVMKIAHITTIDLSLRYLLLNQIKSIQAVGYDVTGISTFGEHVAVIEDAGIVHITVPMTRNFTPVADVVSLWRLYRVIRRERFTIVHTHNPKPGLLGQLAARMAGVPIVINTLHGFYFHDGMRPLLKRFYILTEKIAALCSDIILSQNKEDVQTAIREGICKPEKITLLGNGIDIERFQRMQVDYDQLVVTYTSLGLDSERPVIGFVGRLVAEKGILELFEAFKLVLKTLPKAQLLIVGPLDSEKQDAITSTISDEYGVSKSVVFAGMRQDMPEMYAMMDVFVLPSHREGFPRSPMEASAMNVPCVVTNIRGCREAVEQDSNGILVELGDVDALATAILDIIQDEQKMVRMGIEGRRLAISRFDERLVFEKVKSAYTDLLTEKRLVVPECLPTMHSQSG